MKIYTIMTFEKLECSEYGFPNFGSQNPCGWYISKTDAFKAVENNMCDIWETCYDYALIEEVVEGLYPCSRIRWFFKFDIDSKTYKQIEEPEWLSHFSGFTL